MSKKSSNRREQTFTNFFVFNIFSTCFPFLKEIYFGDFEQCKVQDLVDPACPILLSRMIAKQLTIEMLPFIDCTIGFFLVLLPFIALVRTIPMITDIFGTQIQKEY